MDHGQLTMVADKFQWVFSEPLLNACGKDVKFCRRQRVTTAAQATVLHPLRWFGVRGSPSSAENGWRSGSRRAGPVRR